MQTALQKINHNQYNNSVLQRKTTGVGFERSSASTMQEMIDNSPKVLQRKAMQKAIDNSPYQRAKTSLAPSAYPIQRKENTIGMPNNLKTGLENMSGFDMSNVKVHRNSAKPAQVGAAAYTKGTNIYLAPKQESLLSHEAGHVVQQMQGRVQPTGSVSGQALNDSPGLEKEADTIGQSAVQFQSYNSNTQGVIQQSTGMGDGGIVQRCDIHNNNYSLNECPECKKEKEERKQEYYSENAFKITESYFKMIPGPTQMLTKQGKFILYTPPDRDENEIQQSNWKIHIGLCNIKPETLKKCLEEFSLKVLIPQQIKHKYFNTKSIEINNDENKTQMEKKFVTIYLPKRYMGEKEFNQLIVSLEDKIDNAILDTMPVDESYYKISDKIGARWGASSYVKKSDLTDSELERLCGTENLNTKLIAINKTDNSIVPKEYWKYKLKLKRILPKNRNRSSYSNPDFTISFSDAGKEYEMLKVRDKTDNKIYFIPDLREDLRLTRYEPLYQLPGKYTEKK